jgi:hypothetical protein
MAICAVQCTFQRYKTDEKWEAGIAITDGRRSKTIIAIIAGENRLGHGHSVPVELPVHDFELLWKDGLLELEESTISQVKQPHQT